LEEKAEGIGNFGILGSNEGHGGKSLLYFPSSVFVAEIFILIVEVIAPELYISI